MTALSAKISSDCNRQHSLGAQALHLWLGRWDPSEGAAFFRRRVLARYIGLEPDHLRFAEGAHGKPRLINSPLPIEFNVSHSGDWQVCAVTRDTPVGVDIEHCERERDVQKLSRRFFSQAEHSAMVQLTEEEQLQRFYDLWTLKEARVKALGKALPPDLGEPAFTLDGPVDGQIMQIEDGEEDGTPALQYCLLEPVPQYQLALCCGSSRLMAHQLTLFQCPDDETCGEVAVAYRGYSPGWIGTDQSR